VSRKDFELIARTLRSWRDSLGDRKAWSLANDFADELARANPEFDRVRFMRACGCPD
jgi:hypothetical protein